MEHPFQESNYMRKLWVIIVLLAASLFIVPSRMDAFNSKEQQQQGLSKYLWQQEKLFQINAYWVDLKVVSKGDMKDKSAWGDTYFDDKGAHIEIMDANDMPFQLSQKERGKFQHEILQHEVLHIYMSAHGVPDEFQDPLIHLFQPYMKGNHDVSYGRP